MAFTIHFDDLPLSLKGANIGVHGSGYADYDDAGNLASLVILPMRNGDMRVTLVANSTDQMHRMLFNSIAISLRRHYGHAIAAALVDQAPKRRNVDVGHAVQLNNPNCSYSS